MRKVLHVGPCDTPGGMANVMRILAEHPPEGWEAELLASHVVGSPWAKWRAYRRARKELIRRCRSSDERPDIVHVHTAADWSWRRKKHLLRSINKFNLSTVIHIHSGQFHNWLTKGRLKRANSVRNFVKQPNFVTVALSQHWVELLKSKIGPLESIPNPIKHPDEIRVERKPNQMLLLGRNDPVKGHDFAIDVAKELGRRNPNISLIMTGQESDQNSQFVECRGWVSEEEKLQLLRESSILLVPSLFEGQPMVVLEALSHQLPVLASENLHSMPISVNYAEREVTKWVDFLDNYFQNPSSKTTARLPEEHWIENVGQRWNELYSTLLSVSAESFPEGRP